MSKEQVDIKKWKKEILENRRLNDRNEQLMLCQCRHQYPDGEPALAPTKEMEPGANGQPRPVCRCLRCGKKVSVVALDRDKLQDACDMIDKACDIIKFMSQPKSEDDAAIVKKVVKTQDRVNNFMMRWYTSAVESSKRTKNRRKRSGGSGVSWGRPTSH